MRSMHHCRASRSSFVLPAPSSGGGEVMLEGGFNVLVTVDLEEALHELGRPDDPEKQRQEAHATGRATSVLSIKELQTGSLPCKGCDSRLQSEFDSVGVECLTNEFECGREIFFESGLDLTRRKDEPTFGLAAGTQFDGQ
jgi:hypothetical protein